MKKLIFLFGLFLSFTTFAQDETEGEAKIEFDQYTIDYGTIEKGSNGVRAFTFKNTGTAPLIISTVKSSCGCTIHKKPEKPIMPGKKGEIEVKYDTNRVNPIRKTVTVTSNASNSPTVALKIKGTVINSAAETVLKEKKEKSILEE